MPADLQGGGKDPAPPHRPYPPVGRGEARRGEAKRDPRPATPPPSGRRRGRAGSGPADRPNPPARRPPRARSYRNGYGGGARRGVGRGPTQYPRRTSPRPPRACPRSSRRPLTGPAPRPPRPLRPADSRVHTVRGAAPAGLGIVFLGGADAPPPNGSRRPGSPLSRTSDVRLRTLVHPDLPGIAYSVCPSATGSSPSSNAARATAHSSVRSSSPAPAPPGRSTWVRSTRRSAGSNATAWSCRTVRTRPPPALRDHRQRSRRTSQLVRASRRPHQPGP